MLGNILKKLREDFEMSQEALAQKLNVSPSTIGMYETNKRQPNYETLLKISSIFNCSIDYLLGKTNEKQSKGELDSNLLKIGLDMKNYTPPTEEQKKQIEDFAKFVLKDNKKD